MYRHCVTDPPPALISPLVTATMEHAHGHGSAPDHHERRFITMDHGGGGGPVPVAPNTIKVPTVGRVHLLGNVVKPGSTSVPELSRWVQAPAGPLPLWAWFKT